MRNSPFLLRRFRAIADLEMHLLHFNHFGKSFVKSQRFSPDSFVQMGFQLAFFRIHGVPGATYESGGLRLFRHGRTDVIRSCSPAALAMARTVLDNGASPGDKKAALSAALRGHSDYAKLTVQGRGIDRHLLGLKLMAKEAGLPEPDLLSDPAWTRSTRHRISSSQVSSPLPLACGFPPLVADGYGCCYNIRAHDFHVACSSFASCGETDARRFRDELERSFLDMHDCLLAGGDGNVKSKL